MNYRDIIYQHYTAKFQASGYQRADLVDHWTRAYRWFFRDWLPTDKTATVLDVGCGGGQLLQVMRRLGYANCEGVDISEQQVQKAQAAGLKVSQGNVLEFLRQGADHWDLILAIDILEHLGKNEAVEFLTLARSALKPGGRLIVQMPNPNGLAGMRVRYGDFTHEISMSPDCAARLLNLFGYTGIKCRETGAVPGWPSLVSSVRWVLWQFCRLAFMAFDLVETGGLGTTTYTRVYLISACRPH